MSDHVYSSYENFTDNIFPQSSVYIPMQALQMMIVAVVVAHVVDIIVLIIVISVFFFYPRAI